MTGESKARLWSNVKWCRVLTVGALVSVGARRELRYLERIQPSQQDERRLIYLQADAARSHGGLWLGLTLPTSAQVVDCGLGTQWINDAAINEADFFRWHICTQS